jgi:hypothetical protein
VRDEREECWMLTAYLDGRSQAQMRITGGCITAVKRAFPKVKFKVGTVVDVEGDCIEAINKALYDNLNSHSSLPPYNSDGKWTYKMEIEFL